MEGILRVKQHQPNDVRILALDDDQHILDLYEEFLSPETNTHSCDLTLCRRSEEAVEAVQNAIRQEKPFAVAFVDILMPSGPDGVWAAEQIRTLDPNVEIVIVTAYGDFTPEEIVSRVPPAGKLLFVRKPFMPEEIRQFAAALIAKWQQETKLQKIHTELESHVQEGTFDLLKANEQLKREIEERHRAEEELRESAEKYRTILESIEEGYFEVDLAGNFTFFNDSLCLIAGYSRDELMGMNNRDYTSPETAKEMYHIFSNIFRTGEPAKVVDYEIFRKDGDTRVLEMSASLMRDVSGRPVGFRGVARDITVRKRAEEALRESEERYRSLFNNNHSVMLLIDPETAEIVDANPAACSFYGWSQQELTSKKITDINTLTNEQVFREMERAKSEQRSQFFFRHRLANGKVRDVEVFSGPIKLYGKRLLYSIVHDITERKQAEVLLQESETRYRTVVEDAPAMICRFLPDGTLTFVNSAYSLYFEKNSDDLLGQNFLQFIPEEDHEKVRNRFMSLTQEDPLVTYEHQVIAPNGTVRWQRWTDRALFDEHGRLVEYQSIGNDITESKKAGEALWESEKRYRTVLESNPDPVVVYDIEGKVVYFNPAFTSVFGWNLGERFGKKMDGFVPEENWAETKMMIDRVLAGESFSGVETRRYTKDGNIIPVSISGAVYRDGDGNPVGSVINLRDISLQKNLERQLQQAQKMEAVGTLAGGIAHDFNNLLQAIQGYGELLLMRTRQDESGWRELQEVIRAAKRGGELTQQLLTFSRKVESKRRPLDLNQEVRESRELLGRTIPRMIELQVHLADNLKLINADSVQLKQVLMNLAVNAKDAMPEGGKLMIETENVSLDQEFCRRYAEVKPGDYVLLSISDIGHGMDKETLEHIFDPFYTTKEVGKGTGLGLAIVYGIVKNHEGYIMCYSEPQQGTIFKIYLPVIEPEIKLANVLDQMEPEVQVEGGSETILLVDDEEFIRELGIDVLGQAGYEVLTAADGEGALQLYRQAQERIALVILDLIMPGMGGRKCLEELLRLNPKVKVLIASGYSSDASTKRALETGAKSFVSKPYDTKHLLKLVREVLDG
ncbi:MAG: PAS domain S-box protein [Deltaproteobacteria bacterium]|nr:MAG: PAS domain S-box protein [Deltaproteobacteria bacterium]